MIPDWKRKKLETNETLRQIAESSPAPRAEESEPPPLRRITQADIDHVIAERKKAGLRG